MNKRKKHTRTLFGGGNDFRLNWIFTQIYIGSESLRMSSWQINTTIAIRISFFFSEKKKLKTDQISFKKTTKKTPEGILFLRSFRCAT